MIGHADPEHHPEAADARPASDVRSGYKGDVSEDAAPLAGSDWNHLPPLF